MDKILIVIPVINLWDQYTIHCMESIAASKCDIPFEVLIINQNSTDETVNKAEDFGNRKMPGRVHVVTNAVNRGCAGGWNQGVEWALEHGFTHIVIANNDILVAPAALQEMYNRMKKGGALLVSCLDVAKEVKVPNEVLNEAHPVNNKDESEAPSPCFSCFMITPETIQRVGFFDEGFFPAYFEDNDYHHRMKVIAGENSAIAITKAVFYHFGSRTQNQAVGAPVVPGEMFRKNADYFKRKWGGEPKFETYQTPFNDSTKDHTYAERRNY